MADRLPLLLNALALGALLAVLAPGLRRRARAAAGVVLLAALITLILVRWHPAGGAEPQDPVEAQQLLNGLFLGSIYALIALGYTMVYGVLKLINFAHGEVFMAGAFVALFTLSVYRYSHPLQAFLLALLFAMICCAVLGVVIERAAYRPLRRAPRLAALITAIGVSLLLQHLGLLLVGADPKTVPNVLPTAPLEAIREATGLVVNLPNLASLAAALVLMAGLQYFVRRTRPGRAMRAVSEDREAAQLMGVNVDATIALTFVVGSALAGAAGVLWAILYPAIAPNLGIIPGLKAFVAAVLGGIGSIPGAMIGGLLIGLIEVLVTTVQLSRAALAQGALALVLLVAVWRVGQHRLHALPHTPRGNALRALGGLALLAGCWLVAGLLVLPFAPWLADGEAGEAGEAGARLSGATFRDAVVYTILIVILIVKPTGIMGRYEPEKV